MRHIIALPVLVLSMALSLAQAQTNSVNHTGYTDVLDNTGGFILDNALLADEGRPDAKWLFGVSPVVEGNGSLMVIRTAGVDESEKLLLILQIPRYTEGSEVEFTGKSGEGRFYIVISTSDSDLVQEGGSFSGNVRLSRNISANTAPGSKNEFRQGVGDIDVLVSNIANGNHPTYVTKKYAAQYNLPIVPLEQYRTSELSDNIIFKTR